MNLRVQLESYTLAGSGEGAGIIDCDVVFDRFGLPYLPGRRIKGLLRESAVEVLEMCGINNQETLNCLFGVIGSHAGACLIPNLRFPGYNDLLRHLLWISDEDDFKEIVSRERLVSLYTTIREQTAIDQHGFADDGSLRVCRLLNCGIEFEGEINFKQPLAAPEEALLFLACVNLAQMGVRRNRGQGAIRCTLAAGCSIDEAYALLQSPKTDASTPGNIASELQTTSTAAEPIVESSLGCLPYTVRLVEPVILPTTPAGDQNTVSTADYIPGTAVRGMLAWRMIKRLGLASSIAHDHQEFHHLFLAGGLSFGPAFPIHEEIVFHPAPLCLQLRKNELADVAYDLLKTDDSGMLGGKMDTTLEDTHRITGFVALYEGYEDGEILVRKEPAKTFHFHGSRKDDRIAGRSTANQGAIFTYESLDAGQEFRGEIIGKTCDLQYLKEIVGTAFAAKLGRSRSAQYGGLEITFEGDLVSRDLTAGTTFRITVLSPLLLRNEMGFPEASVNALCEAFTRFFPSAASVEMSKIFADATTFESFNSSAKVKTPTEIGFAEGSSFIVTISGISLDDFRAGITLIVAMGLGERTSEGFGRVQADGYDEETYEVRSDYIASDDRTPFPDTLRNIIEQLVLADITQKIRLEGMRNAAEYSSRPNNHLIGRLDSMIHVSENLSDWIAKLGLLRKTARDNLVDCRWGGSSLYQDLTDFTVRTVKFREDMLKRHASIIARAEIDTADLLSESFTDAKEYWRSLLRRMRQLNKIEEG